MKLYEVNEAIMKAIAILDEEGGEINEVTEQVIAELDALQMERDRILEYLAKEVINLRSDQAVLKTEEDRLKERRKKLETKEDRLLQILDRECAGENRNLGIATVSYRKAESLEVTDAADACKWLKENNHEECIKVLPPEVIKDPVKKLLKNNTEIPGVKLVTKNNMSLK